MYYLERAHHKLDILPPTNVFKFCVEDRIECADSGQVQYKTRNEYFLPFNIPLAAATNIKVIINNSSVLLQTSEMV